MTIEVTPRADRRCVQVSRFFSVPLNHYYADFAKLRAMHGSTEFDLQAAAALAGNEGDIDCELRIFRDVF